MHVHLQVFERKLLQGGGVIVSDLARDLKTILGGYRVNVCDEVNIDNDLVMCSICLLLFRDPMQLYCGHVFYNTCLDRHAEEKERTGNAAGCNFLCNLSKYVVLPDSK